MDAARPRKRPLGSFPRSFGFALAPLLLKEAPRPMDLKTLKLELLERIALLEDEPRLLALKRLLDGPPTYASPGDHLSVVREGEAPYLKLEDRMYTAEEVRKLVEELLSITVADGADLTSEEVADLDASRSRFLSGEGKWLTRKELEASMKERTNK